MNKWLLVGLLTFGGVSLVADAGKRVAIDVDYVAKDYNHLLGMPGFQSELLKMHFQLYQGYVTNTNLLFKSLLNFPKEGALDIYSYGALKRRFGWEFDGMRLHEFYFDNLGGKASLKEDSSFYRALTLNFGSFDAWMSDFVSTAMMRGIGWVILCRDPKNDRLMNVWIAEHDLGHLAGAKPLLVLDVWEHAFITQFGLDRKSYIDAFFKNVNWDVVQARLSTP